MWERGRRYQSETGGPIPEKQANQNLWKVVGESSLIHAVPVQPVGSSTRFPMGARADARCPVVFCQSLPGAFGAVLGSSFGIEEMLSGSDEAAHPGSRGLDVFTRQQRLPVFASQLNPGCSSHHFLLKGR